MLSSFFASDKHEIGVKRTNNTHYDGEKRGDLLRFDRYAQKTVFIILNKLNKGTNDKGCKEAHEAT